LRKSATQNFLIRFRKVNLLGVIDHGLARQGYVSFTSGQSFWNLLTITFFASPCGSIARNSIIGPSSSVKDDQPFYPAERTVLLPGSNPQKVSPARIPGFTEVEPATGW